MSLIEKKTVKIIVHEADGDQNRLDNFKVWVSDGKCSTQKVSELTFTEEEFDKPWNITVEKEGGEV